MDPATIAAAVTVVGIIAETVGSFVRAAQIARDKGAITPDVYDRIIQDYEAAKADRAALLAEARAELNGTLSSLTVHTADGQDDVVVSLSREDIGRILDDSDAPLDVGSTPVEA